MTSSVPEWKGQIGIVGAGPIGAILAGHLVRAGHNVAVIEVLPELTGAMRAKGIRVSGCADITTAAIPTVFSAIADLTAFAPELVFVAVKACSLRQVVPALKAALPSGCMVISFQNGLDTERELANTLGSARVVRMVVNYAGNIVEPGHVKMTFFNKPNYIGVQEPAQTQEVTRIADMLTRAGLETVVAKDIRKQVWEKVILNAALSPLCALTRLTMKAAMDFPPTFGIVVQTLEEGIAVARADGYEFGADFRDFCIAYLRKAGHHKPSMLCDIEAARPTEIDYLSGAIAEYAKKYGISAPVNTTIAGLIRGLEKALTTEGVGADAKAPS